MLCNQIKRGVMRPGGFCQRVNAKMQTAVRRGLFSWLLVIVGELWESLRRARRSVNAHVRRHISPRTFPLVVTAVCALLAFFALFTAPYYGVANDGTVTQTMEAAGLRYLQEDTPDNYNSYFVRVYRNGYPGKGGLTLHILLIRAARVLDYLFTQDTLFDVRFLGAIYLALYLPAIYLLTRSALERLHYFTENVVISVAAVLIFADVSFLSYFNSLYPEPLIFICLLYFAASCMLLQRTEENELPHLLLLAGSALALAFTRRYCVFMCVLAAAFLVLYLRVCVTRRHLAVILAAIVAVGGVAAWSAMPDDFTPTSKIHAMTRGTMLHATDPAKTLSEFGIDGSYELLADASLYDVMPLTEEDNPLLQEGFLDQYGVADIVLYYLRHPGQFFSMLDLGVKSAVDLRRSYCGNFEQSVGMPPRAQTPFWSMYSTYKIRSAPKTIGYLVLLIAAFVIMSGQKTFADDGKLDRFHYVYLITMTTISLGCVSVLTYILIRSGDAQLSQFHFLPGVCMDLLLYYVAAEILYKLNILEQKKEATK